MLAKSDLVTIRDALPGDVNFILATWLRGAYFGNEWFNMIPKDLFMKNYHAYLERLLSSPGVRVTVACLKDDQDVILGYSVTQDTRVHWIHVKAAWRKIGIAKSLLPTKFEAVSHLTAVGRSLMKKYPAVYYNPF